MSKRSREEEQITAPAPKKSKKEKKSTSNDDDAQASTPVFADPDPDGAQPQQLTRKQLWKAEAQAKKKARQDEKKAKKRADRALQEALRPPPTPEELEKRAAKKAERREKKAKKAAKKAEKEAALEEEQRVEAEKKAARKAAKEARRAERRAAWAAKQNAWSDAQNLSSETATSNPSAATSAANSNGASSATSPEPAISETNPGQYIPCNDLENLSKSEIDTYLEKQAITIEEPDRNQPSLRPILSFKYLAIADTFKSVFKGFSAPTPIQAAAWPYVLSGNDMIGVAETGSGKTFAFGVPCIQHILKLSPNKRRGVKAVIVSPTRELATQIFEQIQKLAKLTDIKVTCVYGGVGKDDQREALNYANIVVATPGRLNDFIEEGAARLGSADYVVLDEADRMLDKGFEQEIRKIINSTKPVGERQTLMFTATWPESVRKLASTFMKDPVKILIGNSTGELRANPRVQQVVEVMDAKGKDRWELDQAKQRRLVSILKDSKALLDRKEKILIFCLYKDETERTYRFLQNSGICRCQRIHGDLNQTQRQENFGQFATGKDCNILVATDVAARGLDIPNVSLVINLTFPLTVEDYVHRIGRTGRAGKDGKAITLFTDHEKPLAGALMNVLLEAKQTVPDELRKFGFTVKKKEHSHYGAFYKEVDNTKTATKITFDD